MRDLKIFKIWRIIVYKSIISIFKGNLWNGIKRTLRPLDYWRYFEIQFILNNIDTSKKHQNILDISSPNFLSILLMSLKNKNNINLYQTNILYDEVALNRALSRYYDVNNIKYLTLDARENCFKENYFDYIMSCSVIEHIPDDGDIVTIKNLYKLLKKEGKIILTVPVNKNYGESYFEKDVYERKYNGKQKVFWARYYDLESIQERIVEPSKLTLEKLVFFTEKNYSFYSLYVKSPYFIRIFLIILFPLMVKVLIKREIFENITKQSIACLVLKKS